MADIVIKRNDLLPLINHTLKDADGAIDLSDSTVKFIMRAAGGGGAVKVNAAATIVSAVDGTVRYTWVGTDTDTAGNFEAEWEITDGASKPLSVPNDRHLRVVITEDLA